MSSTTFFRQIAIALTVLACGQPAGVLAAEPAGTTIYVGQDFDLYVLGMPRPSDLVIFDGNTQRFAADGASSTNAEWQTMSAKKRKGELFIENQRRGLDRLEAGVASNSLTLIDEGLEAIEWGLKPMVLGPDASFPDQRDTNTAAGHAIHPKSMFIDAAAHAVRLVGQSPIPTAAMKARASALIPSIRRAAQRFIDSGDAASFFATAQNSNQLAFVASAIFQTGRLANDGAMTSTGNAYMQQVLSRQWSNGVYPEKGGLDTGYHLVTVEIVTNYITQVGDPAWRATLLDANTRAVNWYLTRVNPNGSIDTRNNTRTTACGRPVPGEGPKGPGIDRLAIRLYYHAYLTGSLPEIGPVADSIQRRGQEYDHINKCGGR